MQVIVDNKIVKLLVSNPAKILQFDRNITLSFRWPSLLEYLELGSLLSKLPVEEKVLQACIATLFANEDPEVVQHLYERLFTENLKWVMALEEIEPSFLLQAIQKKRQSPSFLEAAPILSPILATYETLFTKHAANTRHDLILYLAWDRMCVWMARLFDCQSADLKFLKGIHVLRECLIDSYQHITQQGRTIPSLYRMLEALLFYEMREENLQKLTAFEWATLSQSFQALKGQDELVDFFYIEDTALSNSTYYLTLDSPDQVNARLSFAQCMLNRIKSEFPNWDYVLHPKNIAYFESS